MDRSNPFSHASGNALDLRLPAFGPPRIFGFDFTGKRMPDMMVTLIPMGMSPDAARLFAVRKVDAYNLARLGAGGAEEGIGGTALVAERVNTVERDIPARLWERGEHVGAIEIDGAAGRRINLAYLDMSGAGHGSLSLDPGIRRALASPAALLRDPAWRETARFLTAEAAGSATPRRDGGGAYVPTAGKAEEGKEYPEPRLRETSDLVLELGRACRLIRHAHPHLNPAEGRIGTVVARMNELTRAITDGDIGSAERIGRQIAWVMSREVRPGQEPGHALLRGEDGAGAAFRAMMRPNGVVEVLLRRCARPEEDRDLLDLLHPVRSHPRADILRPLVEDPPRVTRHVPDRLSDLQRRLGSAGMACEFPVLALREGVFSRGPGLRELLVRTAAARPEEIRALAERTCLVVGTIAAFRRAGLGTSSWDQACDLLSRGAGALDAATQTAQSSHPLPVRLLEGRLMDDPSLSEGRDVVTARGYIEEVNGLRVSYTAIGAAAAALDGMRAGQKIRATVRICEGDAGGEIRIVRAVRLMEKPMPRREVLMRA